MSEQSTEGNRNRNEEAKILKTFRDMRNTAEGEQSTLNKFDCSIHDQNLERLSSLNKEEPETVRAARFNDGLFLSFRLIENQQIYQYDYGFHSASQEIPSITKWRVVNYRGLTRSEYPRRLQSEYELHDDEIRNPSEQALRILESEVTYSDPWAYSYKPSEINKTRRRLGVKRIVKIAMNPELGEPYL